MLEQIKQTWAEVVLLLGLSGGFWLALEPPVGEVAGTLSGFVGAITVAAVFGVRSVLRHFRNSRTVLGATLGIALGFLVVAVPAFAIFVVDRSRLVLPYEENGATIELIRGTEYYPDVLAVKRADKLSDMQLLNNVGGAKNRDLIWVKGSIVKAERRLAVGYVLTLLLTLLSTMFLVETLRKGSHPSETSSCKPGVIQ